MEMWSLRREKPDEMVKTMGCWNIWLKFIVNAVTPWKINMEPENDGLEDDVPFQLGGF